jgi:phenylacetate-CoA ligase
MQQEQSDRVLTALQEFFTTPLATKLSKHQQVSPQAAALELFRDVAATVPAYKTFLLTPAPL